MPAPTPRARAILSWASACRRRPARPSWTSSGRRPSRARLLGRHALHARAAPRERHVPSLVLRASQLTCRHPDCLHFIARLTSLPWPNVAVSAAPPVSARAVSSFGWLLLTAAGCAGVNGKTLTGSAGQGGSAGMIAAGSGGGGASGSAGSSSTPDAGSTPDASCDGAPGACRPVLCGNGKLNAPAETCDDGNQTGGDGCSPDCHTETDWICPTPGQRCTYTVVLRRRGHCRLGDLRRPKHDAGRRLRCALPARDRVDLPAGRLAVPPSLWRRGEARLRTVRRPQRRRRGWLQRHLSHRDGVRLPHARAELSPDDLRRRREGGRGVVRRRQHLSAATAAARTAGRSRRASVRAAARRPAATGSSSRANSATTATSRPGTAARPTASWSRAGTATT